jgi:surface-adhesin protein E
MRTCFALILVAVLCFSTGGPPAYADWVSLGDSVNMAMTVYADPDTIRRKGDLVKMWDLQDFKTARPAKANESYLSSKNQSEYDCSEKRRRTLAFTWFSGHMGKGDVVYSDSDEDKWEPVEPGSVGKTLWKFACGKPSQP